jgi:hypothetical protein
MGAKEGAQQPKALGLRSQNGQRHWSQLLLALPLKGEESSPCAGLHIRPAAEAVTGCDWRDRILGEQPDARHSAVWELRSFVSLNCARFAVCKDYPGHAPFALGGWFMVVPG